MSKIKKLSQREKEILSFMQDGLKNGAIAKEIGINEKTVSTYVFRIKKKLQLKNEANSYLVVKTYLKEVYSF